MKRFVSYLLLAAILPAFIFTGCKKDDEKGTFTTLSTYMLDNNLDLPTVLTEPNNWVTSPSAIVDTTDYSIPSHYVFDIRSAEDFALGHVKGAMNVALGDVLVKAGEVGKDKPILVICYSGQTAGRAVMALRLSGYKDAQVMKFGMSYWHSDFDKWTAKVSDQADGSSNWETATAATLPVNAYPQWTSGSTDGATILGENIQTMLGASGWAVSSTDVLNDPTSYNIYNFWDQATYESIGHYKGAYLYSTISIANDVLQALPTSDQCLIYCYTGQTSSMATAWLQVLGYNAKSIGYGVNSLRHSALDEAGKPTWHHSLEYTYYTD